MTKSDANSSGASLRETASREPSPSGLSPSGFDPARLADNLTETMISELRNVAEGKPTVPGFGNPVWHLKCLGYVEERTVNKPCRTCGTPQVDYRYDKITEAGRAVLAAASAIEARRAETSGSVADESAVTDPKSEIVGLAERVFVMPFRSWAIRWCNKCRHFHGRGGCWPQHRATLKEYE